MKISQREARRLKNRVVELEQLQAQQRSIWVRDYPRGVHLGSLNLDRDWFMGRIEAARMLGHPIVAIQNEAGTQIRFYAVS